MQIVKVKDLIITCESCGNVKKFIVTNEKESENIFNEFTCENKCGKNLYSFITIGNIKLEYETETK